MMDPVQAANSILSSKGSDGISNYDDSVTLVARAFLARHAALETIKNNIRSELDHEYEHWKKSCLCWKIVQANGFIGEKNQEGACMNCRMGGCCCDNEPGNKKASCDNCRRSVLDNKDRPRKYRGRTTDKNLEVAEAALGAC